MRCLQRCRMKADPALFCEALTKVVRLGGVRADAPAQRGGTQPCKSEAAGFRSSTSNARLAAWALPRAVLRCGAGADRRRWHVTLLPLWRPHLGPIGPEAIGGLSWQRTCRRARRLDAR